MRSDLLTQLYRHEGYRQHPYLCSAGKLTIGIGRNLNDVGISEQEAKTMLAHDVEHAWEDLQKADPIVLVLSHIRQDVLINMVFNMGINKVNGFKRMWAAIGDGDFSLAAVEMLDSKWARQVGARATELAVQMEEGI